MSNSLRKFKRINVKKYTCRKCKNPMSYKLEYGIWVCESCGWEKTDKIVDEEVQE